MNLINCNINFHIAEPIRNTRKARCKHCFKLLQPGEGIGYPNLGYGGGGFYYMCQTDAAVRDRIEATRGLTDATLETIAQSLAHLLPSDGGVDTDTWLGYVSLKNGASLAYGRIAQIVQASGMYQLEVAQAINQALTEDAPATVADVTMSAELAAVHTLTTIYSDTGELLWVNGRLHKAVMEIPDER